MKLAALTLSASFLLFALAGIYTIRQSRSVDDRICEVTVVNRDSTRTAWLVAERLILETQTAPEDKNRTRAFFNAILAQIPELECVGREPVPTT